MGMPLFDFYYTTYNNIGFCNHFSHAYQNTHVIILYEAIMIISLN